MALIAVAVLTAAAMGSGRIAFHVTDGVSMEPTYHAGDFVVIARGGLYRAGDIVAYRAGDEGAVVLHRVIGADGAGFVLKGDNNQSVDPTRPAAHHVIGRAVLHIPKIGAAARSPISRGLFLGTVILAVGAIVLTHHRSAPADRRPSRKRTGRARLAVRGLVALNAVVVVAVVVAFAYPSRPAPAPTSRATSQTGELAYAAAAPVSEVYPAGALVTGDAAFVNLVKSMTVVFRYSTTAAPSSVQGSARLDLNVSAPSGWHTTLPLVPDTAIQDGALDMTGTVDIEGILALAERVAEATSVGAGSLLDVTVTATTKASVDGGTPVEFAAELPFHLTPLALRPTGAKPTPSSRGPVIASTVALSQPAPVRRSAPRRDPIRVALLVALVLCAAGTVVLWPASREIFHPPRVASPYLKCLSPFVRS